MPFQSAFLLCYAVTEPWHRYPERLWGLLLGYLQTHLDVLGTLLWVSQLEQGLGQREPEIPHSLTGETLSVFKVSGCPAGLPFASRSRMLIFPGVSEERLVCYL